MNSTRQIVIYSILRLLLFAVPFTLFMLLSIEWWASALLATAIAVSLSYLLLVKQRHQVAATVESWRHGTNTDTDNDLENAALDAAARNNVEPEDG